MRYLGAGHVNTTCAQPSARFWGACRGHGSYSCRCGVRGNALLELSAIVRGRLLLVHSLCNGIQIRRASMRARASRIALRHPARAAPAMSVNRNARRMRAHYLVLRVGDSCPSCRVASHRVVGTPCVERTPDKPRRFALPRVSRIAWFARSQHRHRTQRRWTNGGRCAPLVDGAPRMALEVNDLRPPPLSPLAHARPHDARTRSC